MNFTLNLHSIEISIYTIKLFFILSYSYYTFLKLINIKNFVTKKSIFTIFSLLFISIIASFLKYKVDSFTSFAYLVLTISILYAFITKNKLGYSILITSTSLSINYILSFISAFISYFPNKLLNVTNDYISLVIILIIHSLLIYGFFRIPRFKNGFSFLNKNLNNEYFDLLILNVITSLLLIFLILSNMNSINAINLNFAKKLCFFFIALAIIVFITIQKLLQQYYKHKLLVTELEETKKELENKKKEISRLEQENLNFSKKSHSIAHKQKALEYKLNQLMQNSEIASEIDIRERVKNLSNEISDNTVTTELSKTGIEQIDDMLKYMQSECVKNKIDFELKLNGNIHSMINNCISVEDLEILIADHIKNAIIAINNCENSNRSILVKLGWIDGFYGFHIYDTGIEFELDTLSNLGKKPMTTHADSGGTGMGFMNTFDTLNKYQASLVINEIGKPCTENYTKSLLFTFNNLHNFEIISYRNNN